MAVLRGFRWRGRLRGGNRSACSSPTGRPPPRTVSVAMPPSGAVSTSSASSARTVTGIRARSPPSEIFSARARPSGRPTSWTPSKPSLASSPGTRRISAVTSRSFAGHHLRVAAHGVRDGGLGAFGRGGAGVQSAAARRPKARAMPRRVRAKSGVPQPSVLVRGRLLAGEVRGRSRATSCCSGCAGIQVALHRPAVDDAGGGHGGVLSRAVLRQLGGRPAAAGAILRVRGRRRGGRCCFRGLLP